MARILNEEGISKHYKNKSASFSEEVLSRLSLDEQSLQIAKKTLLLRSVFYKVYNWKILV